MRNLSALMLCALACGPDKTDSATSPNETTTAATADSTSSSPTSTSGDATSSSPTTTSTTSDTTPGSTTASGACDDGIVDDCCCFKRGGDVVLPTCPAEELCFAVDVECPAASPEDCPVAVLEVLNPDALDCTLDALAGDTPGEVSWSLYHDSNPSWLRSALAFPVGDGTAFVVSGLFFGPDSHMDDTARRALPGPAFFLDCKALPSAAERFECMLQGLAGEPVEVCLPGYDFEWDE